MALRWLKTATRYGATSEFSLAQSIAIAEVDPQLVANRESLLQNFNSPERLYPIDDADACYFLSVIFERR